MYLDKDLELKIRNLAQELFNKSNVKIFELKIFRQANNLVLRLLVDKPQGGISVDECSMLNRELGKIIDETNILEESFILELSSPGIDSILKSEDDFLRVLDKEIICFLSNPVEEKREITGKLIRVGGGSITIFNSKEYVIQLGDITKARQTIKFGR